MIKNILLFLSVLLLIITVSCGKKPDTTVSATWKKGQVDKPPVAVEAVTAEMGSLIPAVEASGVISGGNEAYSVMEARGILVAVNFRMGDFVRKGDLLARIDDALPASSLRLAIQQVETARLNFNASEQLYKNGGISLLELNQSETRFIQAQVARDQARKAVEDCSLRAPVSGFIASKDPSVTLGNLITPGTRAAWIVDTSSYRMELSVGERSISLIREGLPVSVFLSDTGEKVTGQARVQAVAAGSDRTTGSYPVAIEWKDSDIPVKPGMSATAFISLPEDDPRIIIPVQAVLKRDGKPFVYVSRDGTAIPVPITQGRRLGPSLTVLSGLSSGDIVILSGLTSLAPGMKVSPTVLGGSGEIR